MNTEPIWKSWFARHGANFCFLPANSPVGQMRQRIYSKKPLFRIWRLYGHTGEVSPGLVYRAIRRLAIDWARSIDRRQIRENKVALDSPCPSHLSALSNWMSANKLSFVQSSVFPDQQKEVVTLKIWGELTFDEIARTLDESLNTVASRYRYALQKLQSWVPEEMDGKRRVLRPPHERVRKTRRGIKRESSFHPVRNLLVV